MLAKVIFIVLAFAPHPGVEAIASVGIRAVLFSGSAVLFSYTCAYTLASLTLFNLPATQIETDNLTIFIVLFSGFALYITRQTLKGNPIYSLICNLAIAFASLGGTNFSRANLTDANFKAAQLKSSNFKSAILDRTVWQNAVAIDLIQPGSTYFKTPQIRNLAVNGQGINKNFDRLDLRGINLSGANLIQATFIDTALRDSNLTGSDLSFAKLIGTKLDRANLTEANLTGIYLDNLQLTQDPILFEIKSKYVFRKILTKEKANLSFNLNDWQKEFIGEELEQFIKNIS